MSTRNRQGESDSPEKHDSSSDTEGLLPFGEHFEEVSEGGKKVRHKGVYFLPNLFTTSALFAGFYAIVSAMNGHLRPRPSRFLLLWCSMAWMVGWRV